METNAPGPAASAVDTHCHLFLMEGDTAQIVRAARVAGVGRLVLTHIWPTNDRRLVVEGAEAAFDGPVTVAHEGMRVTL